MTGAGHLQARAGRRRVSKGGVRRARAYCKCGCRRSALRSTVAHQADPAPWGQLARRLGGVSGAGRTAMTGDVPELLPGGSLPTKPQEAAVPALSLTRTNVDGLLPEQLRKARPQDRTSTSSRSAECRAFLPAIRRGTGRGPLQGWEHPYPDERCMELQTNDLVRLGRELGSPRLSALRSTLGLAVLGSLESGSTGRASSPTKELPARRREAPTRTA